MKKIPPRPLLMADLDRVLPRLRTALRPMWIGASSFEDRCSGGLAALAAGGATFYSALIVNYSTRVKPDATAERRRLTNRIAIEGHLREMRTATVEQYTIEGFGFSAFQRLVRSALRGPYRPDFVVFDISSLTKIHTLALGSALAALPMRPRWVIAYTMPETYCFDAPTSQPTWVDILIAPLAETASLFNEVDGRGILLPGHESERANVALAELEPTGGTILVVDTPGRPDFRAATEHRNAKLIRQLTSLRASKWTRQVVELTEPKEMARIVREEIAMARKGEAPVFLFGFGPKPQLLVASYELTGRYSEAAWFVYPVPQSYGVDICQGVGETKWIGRGA